MQVDTRERGFSYAYDAPLDMRMDPAQELNAAEIVNTWERRRLARTLREYGEERYAERIAGEIVRRRASSSSTTFELVDAITAAIPAPARFGGGHPAKRTFQAIRIAVNGELDQLDEALPLAWQLLRPTGRAGRDLVPLARGPARQALPRRPRRRAASARPTCRSARAAARPRPSSCSAAPIVPTPGEIAQNPRAKSARLRAARKLRRSMPASHRRRAPRRARPHRARGDDAPAPDLRADRPAARGAGPVRGRSPASSSASSALPDHRVIDRLLRGRVWICFIGVALMGIVAMQVSMLKLNSGISRAVETSRTLERQNSDMEASIARLASGERIRGAADERRHGHPAAGELHYLRVRPGSTAARAARRMRAPSDDAKALMANHGVVPGSLMRARGCRRPPRRTVAGRRPPRRHAATPTATPVGPGRDAGRRHRPRRSHPRHHRHAGRQPTRPPTGLTACS